MVISVLLEPGRNHVRPATQAVPSVWFLEAMPTLHREIDVLITAYTNYESNMFLKHSPTRLTNHITNPRATTTVAAKNHRPPLGGPKNPQIANVTLTAVELATGNANLGLGRQRNIKKRFFNQPTEGQ